MSRQEISPKENTVDFTMKSIGVIRTPFKEQIGTPIQPRFAREAKGLIEIFDTYVDALVDIDGFERIWLLFLLDKSKPWQPRVIPYRDTVERGLFATRAPSRPNPIGLSVVRLLGREGNILRVCDLDILDSTPLLDIKPYVPEFDAHSDSKAGWFEQRREDRRRADGRFHDQDDGPREY